MGGRSLPACERRSDEWPPHRAPHETPLAVRRRRPLRRPDPAIRAGGEFDRARSTRRATAPAPARPARERRACRAIDQPDQGPAREGCRRQSTGRARRPPQRGGCVPKPPAARVIRSVRGSPSRVGRSPPRTSAMAPDCLVRRSVAGQPPDETDRAGGRPAKSRDRPEPQPAVPSASLRGPRLTQPVPACARQAQPSRPSRRPPDWWPLRCSHARRDSGIQRRAGQVL